MGLISTIIPVYNSSKYLERCLDSIIAQEIGNSEIILVDDGSTDGSGAMCDKFAASYTNIKVVHQANRGVSSARNKGLDVAQGEFIHFADSDDFWGGNYYQRVRSLLINNNIDLVICSHTKEIGDGKFEQVESHISESSLNCVDAVSELLSTRDISASLCDKIFRKSLIGNLRFNTKVSHNEDFLFIYEYLKRCSKIYFIPEVYYYYCNNPKSAVRSPFSHKQMSSIDVQEFVLEDVKATFPELYQKARTEFCKVILFTKARMIEDHYKERADMNRITNIIRSNISFILCSKLAIGYKLMAIRYLV